VVFGTGSLACAVGACLARAGEVVTLVGSWAEGRRAIAERGILVHAPEETWSARVRAVPPERTPRPAPVVLVLAKSHQTAEGQRLGVPAPENEDLWRRVRAREGRPAPLEPGSVAGGLA
jgi:ketopantoate reductase